MLQTSSRNETRTLLVIVNPKSRGGRTAQTWNAIEPKLRAALGPLHVEWTRARGDAEQIARDGSRSGVGGVLVAGGDGTASEVATGLLTAGVTSPPAIGLLPLGTGSDLARALGLRRDLDGAIAAITSGVRRRLDVGRVSGIRDGREAVRFFLNISSIGITGNVVAALARRDERSDRGPFSYVAGALAELVRWRSPSVRITIDSKIAHDGPLTFAAVANGRYFGGGMLVAPDAELDDGLLDVVIVHKMARAQLAFYIPWLYRGTHLSLQGVDLWRGRCIEAESAVPVQIEADGEALFALPARIEILPRALELLGAQALGP